MAAVTTPSEQGLGRRVVTYIAAIDLLAAAVLLGAIALDDRPWVSPWLWLGFIFLQAIDHGGFSVPLLHIRQTERLGIEEAFMLMMLFLFPPTQILIGFVAAVALGEVPRRKGTPKILFNMGQMTVAAGAAIWIAYALGPPTVDRPWTILMSALGAAAFFIINTSTLAALFSLLEQRSFWNIINDRSSLPIVSWLGSTSIGLLSGIAAQSSEVGLLIGVVCARVLEIVLSSERGAQLDRERMRALLETSRSIYSSFDRDSVAHSVTHAVRVLLRCDEARLGPEPPSEKELGSVVAVVDQDQVWLVAAKPLEDGRFESKDALILETLAAICSTALTNATLFKQVEAERRKLEESQAELLQSQKLEAVGRLAGGVAHDFNNMLAVILANVEILAADLGDDHAGQEDLAEVQRTVHRASELVSQLLTFARAEPTNPRTVDLSLLVVNLDKMLRRVLGDGVEYQVEITPDLATVTLDPVHAEQIIMNLIVNARDAVDTFGVVSLSLSNRTIAPGEHPELPPGDYVQLVVSDTGHGMDAETIDHVFEPFFTTKEVGRGTGLGLSTIYGIVERAGGRVEVASEVGKGTSVTVHLPVAGDTAEVPTPASR